MIKLIEKFILWFFGHIVFSIGFSLALSEENRHELLGMLFNVDPTATSNLMLTIVTIVGVGLIILGIIMILPLIKYILSKLPFIANKTVKGTKKVLKKIDNNFVNSMDKQMEDEGLERLQRKHGIIKDKKPKESKNSSSADDDEYEYVAVDVSEDEVKREMHSVLKYAIDSIARVQISDYYIHKNSDGSFDIDVHFKYRVYTNLEDDYYTLQATIERLSGRIIDNIAERVGGLGCGFSIIPHVDGEY